MFERLRGELLGSLAVRRAYAWARGIPVLGRALRGIARQVLPQGDHEWIRVPNGLAKGLSMLVDLRSELGYVRGDHEPWVEGLLAKWLQPGDTFVDVGAHIGYFSLCAARLVGSQGTVLSIEPDQENYLRLRANIDRSPWSRVIQTHEAALGASAGYATFRRGPETSGRVSGTLVERADNGGDYLTVRLLTLDEVCGEEMPRVIKIDVEGGEIETLRGARGVIDKKCTRWIIELHNPIARVIVNETLQAAGYHVQLSRPTHPVYADYHQEYAVAEPPIDLS